MAYYAPEGLWTNILDERTVAGGGWRKEVHDFMSLPLLAREGSVIAMGHCDSQPDYDYLDNVELHVYKLAEGKSASCKIYNHDGTLAATFTITMKDGKPQVETDSTKPYGIVVH